MSTPKVKPVVSRDDLKLLRMVAVAYEGRETTRLYAIFVVMKLQFVASGQNLPRKCETITAESNEYDLRNAIEAMGY